MPNQTYFVNRRTNQRCRVNGFETSTDLPKSENLRGDFTEHIRYKEDQLPSCVDMREKMSTVEDQSKIASW
jgi:hypothetical protein